MTTNGKLPPGWRRVKLGDVCEAVRGITFKSEQTTHRVEEGFIACITTSAVQDVTDWDSRRYVPVSTVKNNSQLLKDGDVLVSTANSKALVGKSCLVSRIPEECAFGAFVTVLRTTPAALPEWISSAIRHDHAKQYFYTISSNTTNISNLRTTDLLEFEIPLPPIDEQKRIVAHLNEQMAAAEKAKKAAEELLDAARALPNAFLRDALPLEGERVPHGWRWVTLEDIAKIDYGYTASAKYGIPGPRFLRITDIQDGGVDWESVPFCKVNMADEAKKKLEDGDIVFARTGGTTGKSFLVRSPPRAVFASYLLRVRAGESVSPGYLAGFFCSDQYWRHITDTSRGGAQPNVNAKLLGNLRVPLPPLAEQNRIVARLDEQMAAAARARRAADAAVEELRAVPGALLRRALAGAS